MSMRITSTYVEKMLISGIYYLLSRDHLHIRGENFNKSYQIVGGSGSPPHTWRKFFLIVLFIIWIRITSTYVEKILQSY